MSEGKVAAARGKQSFAVRAATARDIEQVSALDARITGLAKPDYWADMFARFGENRRQGRCFLVVDPPAGRDGGILGFIIGEVRAWEFGSEPCGWVLALSVDAKSRLHGVGEALFQALAARFKTLGITKMRTMVARDNQLHLLFFRGEGMMAGPYIQLEKELE